MQKLLKSYLKKLVNLTGSNRSLLLLKLSKDSFIDLHQLDFLDQKPSFHIIEQLLSQKRKIKLCNLTDSRSESHNLISNHLHRVQRMERLVLEERGSKDLYIGWPFVRGKFKDGTLVRCPLLFFPVSISKEEKSWFLETKKDCPITFNKSFLLAYAHYNETVISEGFFEKAFEDVDKRSQLFRAELFNVLNEGPLDLHFNDELFIDKLIPFLTLNKKSFDQSNEIGKLKLFPEAVIGIFPQGGSYLVPDYDHLINTVEHQNIEHFFGKISNDNTAEEWRPYQSSNENKEEKFITPLKLDAFQEKAIKLLKTGKSIVVQGPPGTGKSQLITNLVADQIANGKKVLVVCQKRAALDVVYQRLQSLEVASFIGLVHDFRRDRKDLYEQINLQIENIDDYMSANNSLDTIQLERLFATSSRRISQISEELNEFKQALYDESEAGVSIKELYLTSQKNAEPYIDFRQEFKQFPIDELIIAKRKFISYFSYARDFGADDYPWKRRVSFHQFSLSDSKKIVKTISSVQAFSNLISKLSVSEFKHKLEFEDLAYHFKHLSSLKEVIALVENPQVYTFFRSHLTVKQLKRKKLLDLQEALNNCYRDDGPELSLSQEEIPELQLKLNKSISADNGVIKRLQYKFFSNEESHINAVLDQNNLEQTKEGRRTLSKMLDARMNLEHIISKIKKLNGAIEVPKSRRISDFAVWFKLQSESIEAADAFKSVRGLPDLFSFKKLSGEKFRSQLELIVDWSETYQKELQNWSTYLHPLQIQAIDTRDDFSNQLKGALEREFDELVELDKICSEFSATESAVVSKLESEDSLETIDEFIQALENNLKLAWIEHIEQKYPILRAVSSRKFDQLENELQEAAKDRLRVSKDILKIKVRERTYQDLVKNRLNNVVTYRDLKHQATKKKRIWPLRKTISQFQDELFNIIPCWMASPEAVSALFPMEQIFDLVIFDEASQCFVEKSLPAIFRGKQIMVAGDKQQLSPFEIYQVRWEEPLEEENPDLEVNSLLELSERHLPEVHLERHYRSQNLSLISFSNQNFYQNRLKVLTDFKYINDAAPAISYIKVKGIWENNQNQIEADQVVKIVRETIWSLPDLEIGIVTFNARQQAMIWERLEQDAYKHNYEIPASLIVKNIENIQGDEKDLIIFSTAYAPDKKGTLRMRFGSLNQAKGENRLNVAITRARKSILVVSSIYAKDLQVENSLHNGPKLLKEYLKYAKEVSDGKQVVEPPGTAPFKSEWYLKNKLQHLLKEPGSEIKEDLPFADLSVKDQGTYLGMILTDDNLYFEKLSPKDAHVYTPFALSAKNWKFKWFCSRNYWNDPEKETERLKNFFYQLR